MQDALNGVSTTATSCKEGPVAEELQNADSPRILKFTALGRTATCAEWSKISGIATHLLQHRAADPSWSPERLASVPLRVKEI
ncbi:hypothetical protein EYE35_03185 [Cereibacter sphaeroides]|nr:hypothetical protein EYE35_03185 [Cereibacter sphaeroides]